jgi:hypothetical protein
LHLSFARTDQRRQDLSKICKVEPLPQRALPKHRKKRSSKALDPSVLTRVLDQAGFHITAASLFRRRDLPASIHRNGRECARLIAQRR